jgi:hypothetical protein
LPKEIFLLKLKKEKFLEVIYVDEWEPNDETDWLTGEYTNKKRRIAEGRVG